MLLPNNFNLSQNCENFSQSVSNEVSQWWLDLDPENFLQCFHVRDTFRAQCLQSTPACQWICLWEICGQGVVWHRSPEDYIRCGHHDIDQTGPSFCTILCKWSVSLETTSKRIRQWLTVFRLVSPPLWNIILTSGWCLVTNKDGLTIPLHLCWAL